MNAWIQAKQIFKRGGTRELIWAAWYRFQERRRLWTYLGRITNYLVNHIPTRQPTILIWSLPRSGSSWVGGTLGRASNALYLREPITLGQAVIPVWEKSTPLQGYQLPTNVDLADKAFRGYPDYRRGIISYGDQWTLASRPQRHVVIKEVQVEPYAWLIEHYRPRVVFLVRHPAAVALSYRRLKWASFDSLDDWQQHGQIQARAQRLALDVLAQGNDYCSVQYEDLCLAPAQKFQELFQFAGLHWGKQMDRFIETRTSVGDDEEILPWEYIRRNSRDMINRWRSQISIEQLQALRQGYQSIDLPWYSADADWDLSVQGD